MELTAAIEALAAQPAGARVEIYTDSQYLRNGITEWIHQWSRNNYRTSGRKPLKNVDLWRALVAQIERCDVRWNWVKAHAGDRWNERADALARDAVGAPQSAAPTAGIAADLVVVRAYLGVAHAKMEGRGGLGVVMQYGPHVKKLHRSLLVAESPDRMHLEAALDALDALTRAVPIEIHTTSDNLAKGAVDWLPGWRARGWRGRRGGPVKFRELWERLGDQLDRHRVSFVVVPRGQRDGLMNVAKRLARTTATAIDSAT